MGNSDSVIWAMWVPVVVFAHLLAFFFLLKTYMLNSGGAACLRRRKAKAAETEKASAPSSSVDGITSLGKAADEEAPASPPAGQCATHANGNDVLSHNDQCEPSDHNTPFAQPSKEVVLNLARNASASSLFADHEDDKQAITGRTLSMCMSVQVEKSHLEWRGVGCSYPAPGGGLKVVLHDVWGKAHPGEMQVRMHRGPARGASAGDEGYGSSGASCGNQSALSHHVPPNACD